jgi:hypothetical protein
MGLVRGAMHEFWEFPCAWSSRDSIRSANTPILQRVDIGWAMSVQGGIRRIVQDVGIPGFKPF